MWDAARFTIGIVLVVVMPMVAFGGVPWTAPVFLALIGFEIWRRRRHVQRIAGNPALVAADRQSQILGVGAAVAALGGVLLMGAAIGSGSESLAVLSLVAMAAGFVAFVASAIRSGNRMFVLCAAGMGVITAGLFLRQTLQLW